MSEDLKNKILELLKDKEFIKALADALSEYFCKKDDLLSLRDDIDDALYEIREEIEKLKSSKRE